MKIDIRNFINSEIGERQVFDVGGKIRLDIDEEVKLKKLEGEMELTNLGREILAKFDIYTLLEMVCVRCLKEVKKEMALKFERIYGFEGEEEKLPISKNLTIDIAEPIREEIILNIPMKVICDIECRYP